MSAQLQVFEKEAGSACIMGARLRSAEAKALKTWLAKRSDVATFKQQSDTGIIDVEYNDGDALPGRFVRCLRDVVYAIPRRRTKPLAFQVEPVHSLRGRVRLRASGINERQLDTLTMLAAGMPGVTHTKHFQGGATTVIVYDPEKQSEKGLLEALRKSDPVELARSWHKPAASLRWGGAVTDTAVVALCLSGVVPFPVLAGCIVLSTIRPLRRTIKSLGKAKISIDLLDVAATLAALATGRPTTAAFVIWMVGVGDLLLDMSANKARSALSALMQLKEQHACLVLADGSTETIPVGDLRVGDHFMVNAGHGIPVDGKVISGVAEVDEKALSGESNLLPKKEGDLVAASTVLVEGSIVVEVQSFDNTEAAKIEKILGSVGSKPLTLQRDALDFAGKLVLPTFGVAGLAAALSSDITRGVSVLISDFGTGIRIAVPTSAMSSIALAAREGVLFKGAQFFERLSKTDVVIFDKTGTLTSGVPEVVEVVTTKGMTESTLIELCASAEASHDHPVAKALKSYAVKLGISLVEVEEGSEEYAVGLGLSVRIGGRQVRVGRPTWMESQKLKISAPFKNHLARFQKQCTSSLCVAVGDEIVGLVSYSDGLRPDSADIVKRLRDDGRRKVVLLSGDSPEVVAKVSSVVGIDEAVGGLLPLQKADYVKNLRAAGKIVAMVGDGINDAPAMALADVGISFAGSSDVALEAADVVLLHSALSRLETAFQVSDRAMSSVKRDLGIIVVPNAIAIALGAFGLINPAMAAIITNGATVAAVLAGTLPLLRKAESPSQVGGASSEPSQTPAGLVDAPALAKDLEG